MDNDRDIDLFLIGKTGHGKSATGNSILQKPGNFKAMPTTQSVTTDVQFDYSVFDGRTIKVVDGPGVGDNRMSDEEALKEVQERLVHTIAANPDGYHAFLVVVRYGGRFTKEDVQTLNCLKKIFGVDFVKNFCILVITCGDNFESDAEEEDMTFDQWMQNQRGVFEEMMNECNKRVILFDNKTKDKAKQNDQVSRLLSIVDSLGGKRYTDENFEKARHLREKQMIESKEARVTEETLKETSVLLQALEEIQLRQPEQQVSDLKDLVTRANKLLENVQDQDKGTGALKYSVEAAHSIATQIKSQLEHCQKVVQDKKKFYEEQKHLQEEFAIEFQRQKEAYEKRVQEMQKKEEEKRKEEKEAMQKKWEEEQKAKHLSQQKEMEALRKEMENKNEQERLQMEKVFEERVKSDAVETEERRRKQLAELNQKVQEAEAKSKMLEGELRRELETERRKREEEKKRREEQRAREWQLEQERHEYERMKAVLVYKQAKREAQKELLKGVLVCVMDATKAVVDEVQSRLAEKENRTRELENGKAEDQSGDGREKNTAEAKENGVERERKKNDTEERKKDEDRKKDGEGETDMDQTEVVSSSPISGTKTN